MQLTDPILHPVFLANLLDKKVPGWLDLDAQALRDAVGQIGPYSQENWSKIQAAKTARVNDAVLDDFRAFSFIVQALNGNVPDFRVFEPPELPELLAGAQMVMLLRPEETTVYSSGVIRYVSVVCDIVAAGPLPDPLQETSKYVRVPVDDPDRVKDAVAYADAMSLLLLQQLRGLA